MNRKTSVTEAPYDDKGNLLSYVGYGEPSWKPNEPFAATLRLVSWGRGRSAAYFLWEDFEGHQFPMFMTDAFEIFHGGTVIDGTVTARWIVRKRGQNYGIGRES